MPVTFAALDEGIAILPILLRSIELPALAVAGRAVPLEVAQVGAGRAATELVAHDPGLDHDAPGALARSLIGRPPLQLAGDGLAAADPRAPSLPGRSSSLLAAAQLGIAERAAIGLGRCFHHLVDERRQPAAGRASLVADTPHARLEVRNVVSAHKRQVDRIGP
jgi:hypothetical protein